MKRSSFLVGLDIGTSEVRCAVGVAPAREGDNIQILGVGAAKNDGLNRGVISQLPEVIEAIGAAVEQAETITGQPIKAVTVNINGAHLTSQLVRDDVGVSNLDRRVVDQDVRLLSNKLKTGRLGANESLVQFFPREYRLDDQRNIKNPLDLTGKVLGLEALIVKAASSHLETIDRACAALSLKINHRTFSGLAAWEAVFQKKLAASGVAVLDIGAATTNLVIIRDSEIVHVAVIPIGGNQITNDLAIGLKIDLESAEKVKTRYIDINFNGRGTRALKTADGEVLINKALAAEIARARLEELATLVGQEIDRADCRNRLPGGLLLTGGSSNLVGLTEFLTGQIGLAVRLGQLRQFDGLVAEVQKNRSYLTVVGLLALDFVLDNQEPAGALKIWQNRLKQILDRLTKFFAKLTDSKS